MRLRLSSLVYSVLFCRGAGEWDVHGLLALKFGVCVMVLLTCEFIGRRKPITAVRLATAAIVMNCFPVVVGAAQVAGFLMTQP